MLDRNLIGDGLADMISGFVGGPAGTNYGEKHQHNGNHKGFFNSGAYCSRYNLAMVISASPRSFRLIYGIPTAVIGGLEIYLFGAIAAQGIAIMIQNIGRYV
jgi:uracil permease